MLNKCVSYVKNVLSFNWLRDLLVAGLCYTLMVSFSIVRMPLCSFFGEAYCKAINSAAFSIVFYLSYFFSLYVLYLFIKFIVYICYMIYRGIRTLLNKRKVSKSSKTVVIKAAVSTPKSKKPAVVKITKKSKTTKK